MVLAAVAVPWYVLVGLETDWEWPKSSSSSSICVRSRSRSSATATRVRSTALWPRWSRFLYYFYHIPAILVGFFPWSVFLGPTLVDAVRRLREGKTGRRENGKEAARRRVGATAVAAGAVLVRRVVRVLVGLQDEAAPLSAAGLSGVGAADGLFHRPLAGGGKGVNPFAERPERSTKGLTPFRRWALRNAWISTILVGVGIMIAIPIVAAKYLPGEESLGLLGLLLVLGGGWCWWKTCAQAAQEAAITFAITSVAFLTAVFGFAALRVDRFQNAKPMMAAICADENRVRTASSSLAPLSPIATYDFFRESTVFYGGKPVTKCDDDEATGRTAQQALAEFLAKPGRSYVITTDEYEPEIEKAFPGRAEGDSPRAPLPRRRRDGDISSRRLTPTSQRRSARDGSMQPATELCYCGTASCHTSSSSDRRFRLSAQWFR